MRRLGALTLLLVVVLLGAAPAVAQGGGSGGIVVAQEGGLPGFLRFLFRPPTEYPSPVPPQAFPRPGRAAPPPAASRPSAPPTPREIAAVEKAEDATRVLVVGDFLASALAKGLADAHAENPNVLVIDASNGSSGLVRDDFYNWPAALPELVASRTPDVVLVLVGGNDRQTLRTEAGALALGTDQWRAAYAGRVAAFADALKATGLPVLWIGLVPVEASSLSRDYSVFNSILREQLEVKGIRFIETWNGFADEEGRYVAVGPDIRGQEVQLRTGDGLNFTRAGQRKLAFFVEQDLAALLGGTGLMLGAVDPAAALGAPAAEIGPMVPFEALAVAGGGALSGGGAEEDGESVAEMIAARLSGGAEDAPPAGRVDYYVWPRPLPTPDEDDDAEED
jgi:hypothetical protein